MKEYLNCSEAIQDCLLTKRFTIASLYSDQKTLDMHIHECYEIYYAISGGNRFFIADKWYNIQAGDLFVINHFETHHVFERDDQKHERYVISVHPDYLSALSTSQTNLAQCFENHSNHFSHQVSLNEDEQRNFKFLLGRISSVEGFGSDIIENIAFSELLLLVNQKYLSQPETVKEYRYHPLISQVIDYLNQNITESLALSSICAHFFLSKGYLCRLFKQETGTTINKYIISRRIAIAKSLLKKGKTVVQTCEECGFNNYANFIRTFTKTVGISPKRYGQYGK